MRKARPVAYELCGLSAPRPMTIKACRHSVERRLRALPVPRDMIPAEKLAARAVLAQCRICGRCERAL